MDEDPEALELLGEDAAERPPEAFLNRDLDVYRIAWADLQHDRYQDGMGGIGGIYYTAVSRYATDHFIHSDDFPTFIAFIRAQDAEYLNWIAEKRQSDEDRRRNEKESGAS